MVEFITVIFRSKKSIISKFIFEVEKCRNDDENFTSVSIENFLLS